MSSRAKGILLQRSPFPCQGHPFGEGIPSGRTKESREPLGRPCLVFPRQCFAFPRPSFTFLRACLVFPCQGHPPKESFGPLGRPCLVFPRVSFAFPPQRGPFPKGMPLAWERTPLEEDALGTGRPSFTFLRACLAFPRPCFTFPRLSFVWVFVSNFET